MKKNKKLLSGLVPPMVTPLNEDKTLDITGVKKMCEHLIKGGVDGIFLLGTTGEGPHLAYAMRAELIRIVCEYVKGRVQVLAAVTDTTVDEAVALAKVAKDAGCTAVVATTPYYFKLTQAEVFAYFTELANRSPLPLVLYDMPAHIDTIIEPATVAKLATHKNIIGMKDSSSVIALFNKYKIALEPFADKFALMMGPDEAMGEAVLTGADGGVCTGANLWPDVFAAMYKAAVKGDVKRVRELQRFTTMSSYLIYGIGQGQIGFLKGVKAALSEMGLIKNVLASPFTPFAGEELTKVRAALRKLKVERKKII